MTRSAAALHPSAPRGRAGAVVWLTGLPACGKTTAAGALVARLADRGYATTWLDSDDLRHWLTPEPTYEDDERHAFYAALGHLAELAAAGGAIAVVSATAHRRAWRDAVRERVARFCEVWLACDRATLAARDPKGLYARAARGELDRLPGLGIAYEAPLQAELVVDATQVSPDDIAEQVVSWLES